MILFDANKCVSCNSCIRACPTPEANKAVQTEDGRTVYNIDPDKCIRCGACVKDCSHGARTYEDDTAGFWNDVKGGKQVVLLVAPSIKVAFDGCWRNVLEFLRSNGVNLRCLLRRGYLHMGAYQVSPEESRKEAHLAALPGYR